MNKISTISGKELYKDILNRVHNGNINEMYEYFKKNIERIDVYGDTIEKKLINYCNYKSDIVLRIYGVK